MRRVTPAYPEFLAVDATYRLLRIRTPVYVFLVEDANGGSEIAGVGFLAAEDEKNLEWLFPAFKSRNASAAE